MKESKTQQQVWDYIGRNILFEVNDLSMVLDVKEEEIKAFCEVLRAGGYLTALNDTGQVGGHTYRRIRYTGKRVPTMAKGSQRLLDNNIQEVQEIQKRSSIFVEISKAIMHPPCEPFCRQDIVQASNEAYENVSKFMRRLHHDGKLVLQYVDPQQRLYYLLCDEIRAFFKIGVKDVG